MPSPGITKKAFSKPLLINEIECYMLSRGLAIEDFNSCFESVGELYLHGFHLFIIYTDSTAQSG